MEHPPHPGELPDNGHAVLVGLPVVDDDRQVQLLRQGQLGPEHRLLPLPGRVVLPVVVQSDLPDGHHLGAGLGQRPDLLQPVPPHSRRSRLGWKPTAA